MDQTERAFLEIENSVTGQRWQDRCTPAMANVALTISQNHNISDLVSRVLASRGVSDEDAAVFLNPTLRELMPDPSNFTDMDKAAERIGNAIIKGERVAIFGDYDVDGASSAALMARFLRHYGVGHEIYIPDRIFEGYGPNPQAISELVQKGAQLIITVDCGATSFEALDKAAQLNVDVVVLDHHQMNDQLPLSHALVNANRQDDLSGQGHLCAAGVVFMTLVAVSRWLRANKDLGEPPNLMEMLDLVALATICDVVPLVGLNRAFVINGLKMMHQRKNAGIAALAESARLDGPINAYHLGFVLGPRINAGGRIGDAALGARLLSETDLEEARQIAAQLEMLNTERQQAEARMLQEAIAEAEAEIAQGDGPSVIVTESETWHPGIVGLLASRLKDRFKRPALAIAFDGMGKGSGSARSVSGVDLGASVRAALEAGILVKGGGHSMAAGLTVMRDRLADLRAFLEENLQSAVAVASAKRLLEIDGALTARSANLAMVENIERAGPFGAGNPQPMFAFPAHTVRYVETMGENHIRLTLASSDGATLKAVCFRALETPLGDLLMASNGQQLHVAGTLNLNHWRGRTSVQLRIVDAAKVERLR